MMEIYRGETGIRYLLDSFPERRLGGEGEVFLVRGQQDKVAKIYHKELLADKREKLIVMYKARNDIVRHSKAIAWVSDVLYNAGGRVCGFVMPKLQFEHDISDVYQSGNRSKYDKQITLDDKTKQIVARNLCKVISVVHNAGYVFGDFNPNNIGVSENGTVSFCDTDSYHITDKHSGKIYPCEVCCPGYAAPELLFALDDYKYRTGKEKPTYSDLSSPGLSLPTFSRNTDNFALAIHIFRILQNGASPYIGVKQSYGKSVASPGTGDQPVKNDAYCFRPGYIPPPKSGIRPLESFSQEIAELFARAFVEGRKNPDRRPSAQEWYDALKSYQRELTVRKAIDGRIKQLTSERDGAIHQRDRAIQELEDYKNNVVNSAEFAKERAVFQRTAAYIVTVFVFGLCFVGWIWLGSAVAQWKYAVSQTDARIAASLQEADKKVQTANVNAEQRIANETARILNNANKKINDANEDRDNAIRTAEKAKATIANEIAAGIKKEKQQLNEQISEQQIRTKKLESQTEQTTTEKKKYERLSEQIQSQIRNNEKKEKELDDATKKQQVATEDAKKAENDLKERLKTADVDLADLKHFRDNFDIIRNGYWHWAGNNQQIPVLGAAKIINRNGRMLVLEDDGNNGTRAKHRFNVLIELLTKEQRAFVELLEPDMRQ